MHKDRPVAQLQNDAAPGKRPGLRACLMLMLGAGPFVPPHHGRSGAKGEARRPAGCRTWRVCGRRHLRHLPRRGGQEVRRQSSHQDGADARQRNGVTCENCHGAGSEHVDGGGDVTKIFNPAKAFAQGSGREVPELPRGRASQLRSFSARQGRASAASVATAFTAARKRTLLKAPQPTLCYQCHADQKAQFNMPIHHKVNEGLVKCTDCHDVHGTFLANNLKSTEDQNAICTKCHTDVRGPFTFEHAPVRAEGCMTCHTPHGTQNPRLLNMPSIATLCNQCHSPLSAGGVHGLDAGFNDSDALRHLPHHDPRLERKSGIYQMSGMPLRASPEAARRGFRNRFEGSGFQGKQVLFK